MADIKTIIEQAYSAFNKRGCEGGRTLNPELDNAVGIEAFGASAMRPSDPYQSINRRELMSIVESDLRSLRRLVIGEKRMRTPQDSLKV